MRLRFSREEGYFPRRRSSPEAKKKKIALLLPRCGRSQLHVSKKKLLYFLGR